MPTLRPTLWTTFAVFLLDQATKLFVVQWLDLKSRGVILVLDPYLTLRMAWNEGVNFGIPLGDRWVLIALAVAICAWILWWMHRDRPGAATQVSAGLVLGGAIGNVVDRIAYGAVADFLNMSCCGIENPWSFNVADIAIFLGAVGLILLPSGRTKDA